ncbi:hypothetical protein GGF46_003948 [Coemansia sp. RSA 552]|nr:hypothetical protein GGF46_003948 [Coemansia sp. RSA 552]
MIYDTFSGFKKLFVDSDGTPVVYTFLREIILESEQDPCWISTDMRGLELGAPFPQLRKLEIEFDYPFNDDLPFRDNLESLEHIKLSINETHVRMLLRHNVLAKSRLKSLKFLYLLGYYRSKGANIPDNAFLQLCNNVLALVQTLVIEKQGYFDTLIQVLPKYPKYTSLRELWVSAGDIVMTLEDVTSVLQAFPNLGVLDCVLRLEEQYTNSDIDQACNKLQQMPALPHNGLHRLVVDRSHMGAKKTATCIMLVIAACARIAEVYITGCLLTDVTEIYKRLNAICKQRNGSAGASGQIYIQHTEGLRALRVSRDR